MKNIPISPPANFMRVSAKIEYVREPSEGEPAPLESQADRSREQSRQRVSQANSEKGRSRTSSLKSPAFVMEKEPVLIQTSSAAQLQTLTKIEPSHKADARQMNNEV